MYLNCEGSLLIILSHYEILILLLRYKIQWKQEEGLAFNSIILHNLMNPI